MPDTTAAAPPLSEEELKTLANLQAKAEAAKQPVPDIVPQPKFKDSTTVRITGGSKQAGQTGAVEGFNSGIGKEGAHLVACSNGVKTWVETQHLELADQRVPAGQ